MPSLVRTILILISSAGLLLQARSSEASCGLEYCALPTQAPPNTSAPIGNVEVQVRRVDFSIASEEGSYLESIVRIEFWGLANWKFGAWLAPVLLDTADGNSTGITNPVFFTERQFSIKAPLSLTTGIQVEIPLGDSHNGIASSHTELLPYIALTYDHGPVVSQMNAGLAFAMGGGHSHGEEQILFVNPHEDKEALLRVAVMVPILDRKLFPGIQVNSRYVLEEMDERNFITGALTSTYRITDATSLIARVEIPLTSARRYNWNAGTGLGWSY